MSSHWACSETAQEFWPRTGWNHRNSTLPYHPHCITIWEHPDRWYYGPRKGIAWIWWLRSSLWWLDAQSTYSWCKLPGFHSCQHWMPRYLLEPISFALSFYGVRFWLPWSFWWNFQAPRSWRAVGSFSFWVHFSFARFCWLIRLQWKVIPSRTSQTYWWHHS